MVRRKSKASVFATQTGALVNEVKLGDDVGELWETDGTKVLVYDEGQRVEKKKDGNSGPFVKTLTTKCIDMLNGEVVWESTYDHGTRATIFDGRIFYVNKKGELAIAEAWTGKVIQTLSVPILEMAKKGLGEVSVQEVFGRYLVKVRFQSLKTRVRFSEPVEVALSPPRLQPYVLGWLCVCNQEEFFGVGLGKATPDPKFSILAQPILQQPCALDDAALSLEGRLATGQRVWIQCAAVDARNGKLLFDENVPFTAFPVECRSKVVADQQMASLQLRDRAINLAFTDQPSDSPTKTDWWVGKTIHFEPPQAEVDADRPKKTDFSRERYLENDC